MSLIRKVFLSLVFATAGALIAWVLVDFNGFHNLSQSSNAEMLRDQLYVGAVFGLMIGIAMGAVNGLSSGSMTRLFRNLGWGALVGLVGGLLGMIVGQQVYGGIHKSENTLPMLGPFQFIGNMIARSVGWALIGLFIGMSQGFADGSAKTRRHGVIGGCIGGFLGGTLFEITPYILPANVHNVSVVCRGIGMTVTGAFIGFFIGLVENLMKQAWIRVVKGRNEGREYIISKPRVTIGRNELADIGLFGDSSIAPVHAVIEEIAGGRHILKDGGSPTGTVVNSQKIDEHLLRDGEAIQIGSMRLEFFEKATAGRVQKPSTDVASKPAPQIPTEPDKCPFCGNKKDAATGTCACTFTGKPVATATVPPAPSWPPPAPTPEPDATFAYPNASVRLVGLSGPYTGKVFPLPPVGAVSIGRSDHQGIQLSLDTTISRKHGRIVSEGGIYVIYDDGSANGTKVNGIQVARQELRSGDSVTFGSSTFRFEE